MAFVVKALAFHAFYFTPPEYSLRGGVGVITQPTHLFGQFWKLGFCSVSECEIFAHKGQLCKFIECEHVAIVPIVDVIVTSECIHLYFLSIVTRRLFRDVLVSCHAPMFRLGRSVM